MAQELYTKMGKALNDRGLMLYVCEWGIHDPWKWGAETGATCWRMTYDHRDGWWGKIDSGLFGKRMTAMRMLTAWVCTTPSY